MKIIFTLIFFLVLQLAKAQVTPLFPCSERLTSAYGICSHITEISGGWNERDIHLQRINKLGASWVRSDFFWTTMKSDVKNEYNFALWDSLMISCGRNNVKLLPILANKLECISWKDTSAYYNYVRLLSNRYSSLLPYWEVMNEVDLIKDDNSAINYTAMLGNIRSILKCDNPDTQVVLTSISSPTASSFYADICKYGALDVCDVVNFHSYVIPEEMPKQLYHLQNQMNLFNKYHPVWITETSSHTIVDTLTNEAFFTQIVPQALAKLGMQKNMVSIGVIRDYDYPYSSMSDDEMENMLSGFREVHEIDLDSLRKISPDDIPVLVATSGELFPFEYFQSLVRYVRKGGTIILPYGLPFFYDITRQGEKKPMEFACYKKLHISAMFPWSDEAKSLNVPEHPLWSRLVNGFTASFFSVNKDISPRYLTEKNLRWRDKMIPIVEVGNDQYCGVIVAIYQLRSRLRGNIIVSTRMDRYRYKDRAKEQARRVARLHILPFAYGVDKVMWYNLRSWEANKYNKEHHFGLLHLNMTYKPSAYAYKALTSMLPNGSTRPILINKGKIYVATWQRPDKQYVTAVWNVGDKRRVILYNYESYDVYDYMGWKTLSSPTMIVADDIVYIVGNTPAVIK